MDFSFSFFVPRVSLDMSRDFIASVFNDYIGMVDRVDFVYKIDKNCVPYNAAYVHMKSYYSTRYAQEFRNKVMTSASDESAKLYYNGGRDYFIVLKNNTKKHPSFNEGVRKQRLVLDEDMPSKNPPHGPRIPLESVLPLEYLEDPPYYYNIIAPALDGVVRYIIDDNDYEEEYREARREICIGGY